MRRKKHKHTRRAVNFYKVNYGFHEPYKVLLDGNFIHATRTSNLSDLDTQLSHLLGGRVKLYTTRCVMAELRAMAKQEGGQGGEQGEGGDEGQQGFRDTLRHAKKHGALHHCGHEAAVMASDCLRAQLGGGNPQHWFVATQDQALRQALAKVPGAPVIFATVNGIHLEAPSEATKDKVKKAGESHQRLQAHELQAAPLADLPQLQRQQGAGKSIFRRNKAKGPNPLSIRKKAKGGQQQQASQAQGEGKGKIRKRTRSKQGASGGADGAGGE